MGKAILMETPNKGTMTLLSQKEKETTDEEVGRNPGGVLVLLRSPGADDGRAA
jgi:hypothetical protein